MCSLVQNWLMKLVNVNLRASQNREVCQLGARYRLLSAGWRPLRARLHLTSHYAYGIMLAILRDRAIKPTTGAEDIMSEMETVSTVETPEGRKIVTVKGTIENAYGRKLDTNKFKEGFGVVSELSYEDTYEEYTDYAHVPKDEKLTEADMLKTVNDARRNNARQKAMQTALDKAGVIKPTMEDDDELKIASIVKGLVASKKYNAEQARQLAKQMLGLS